MNRSLRALLVVFLAIAIGKSVMAQGTAVPSYCTSISATNIGSYGMGIQNVTLNTTAIPTQINNTTSAGSGTPIYFDYTSQTLMASASETVNYSIKGGNSNQTLFRIYIDYNNDGTFATSGSELVFTSANLTTANTVVTGTFTIPSTQQPGIYRIRIASDGQGNIPQPCGPLVYSAEFEDYTLVVPNASVDVAANIFTSPSLFVIGSNTIGMKFYNLHSTTVTSADIGYQLGSNTPVTQSLSSISVAQGSAYTATFSTALSITTAGTYTLRTWVTNPNGNGTGISSNDTIYTTFTVCDPFTGTYTINPSGSGATNYTSFTAAIAALQCGGASGPVVFNVAAGTYNEQITIPAINGASATNTITFQSASLVASSVTLSYAATSTGNYVINLNGADYITFNKMTIANTGSAGYYNVIQLANTANYNTFRACAVTTSQTTSGYLVYQSNTIDSYNRFVSNTFTNGSAGIFLSGNSSTYPVNNVIDSNTFNSQYNYAIYSYYQDTIFIRNNTISSSSATTYYGIYSYWNSRKPTISGNRMNITGASTQYAMYLQYFDYYGSSTNRGLVANNMMQVGSGAATSYGIYFPGGYLQYYTDIVHNTINVTTTGSGAALYVGNTLTGCNIANNIFQTSSTSATAYALQVTGTTYYSGGSTTSNYNNYYSAGTNQVYWGATAYTSATFSTYQSTSAVDTNSKNKQVYFTSSSDLHHSASCLAAAGTNTYYSLVGIDYDNVARNSTTPCIGATEYTASAYDLAVSAITAPTSYSASAQTVSFTVRNNGTTTITAFDAGYNVNYGTTTSQTFSSLSLAACDQTTLSFTTQVSLPSGVSVLRAFNSGNLNGSNADASASNDTTYTQYSGGMSGTYTINPGAAASTTNFQTFAAAISALSAATGVTGPVIFNVSAGTYYEQLIIPAITGSSTTNTITFDGGTAANTIVTCAGISTNYSVFRLSNASHIRLQNMTIRNTGGSYGWGVHIYATSAVTNIKVNKCIIKNTSTSAVTGTSSFAGIVASGSLTSATTSTSVAMTTIELDTNTIDSAYYGIIVYSSTSYSSGVTIRKNTLTNIYYYPIYSYYLYGANVSNNTITLTAATSTTSSFGMYFLSCNTTGSNPTYINGNNIYGAGTYGIYLSSCAGSATAQCQLYNNMIRGGFRITSSYGIYLTTVSYYNVYHNSVSMDFATTSSIYSCMYQTGGTASTCNIKNNNFAYTSSGSGYAAYLSTTNNIDYNNYYKLGAISSTVVAYYGGYGNLTQASLSGGSQNANSVSTNPNFTSSTDLHVTDGCLLGTNLSVATDIDGDSRSTTPTIGADEYTRLNNDLGISALLYPSAPASPGTQQIIATLKNYGLNTVTSATVKYSVNGGTPVSVSWTGSLAPCGTTSITFTGANQYTFAGGTNVVKVWSESPNSTTDARPSNDTNTTTLQICNGLSGAYTINPSGSGATNYTTFAAAKADLVSCGVSGAVTFTVSAGTYTEQLLLSAISGVSSTNTITFDGGTGNAATRIITYAPTTAAAAYTVRLNGSSYVRFKNLTIRSTGATYANAVHIMGASHYSQIKNCIIEITGTGTTSTASTYIPLIINNTDNISSPSTGSQVNYLEIDSNTINSGYYNIYMYGLTSTPYSNSNKIRYNTLTSAYQYGILFYFQDGLRIQNNTLAMRTTGSSSSYGIYCSQSVNSGSNYAEISGNKITDAGGYGMILQNFSGSATYRNKVINNMIGGGFRTTGMYGVQLSSASYMDFWNNTINVDLNGGSAGTSCLYSSSTSFIDIRNNIFVVSATSGSTVPVYINTATDPSLFDYNNFTNASSTNLIYLGGTYATTSTYQGLAGFNSNSQNVNVSFTSSSNLHHSNACLNGTYISYVTTDIDGQTRGSTPDMGADEISGANNDLGVYSISAPGTAFIAGTQDVKVVIRNYGTNTITSGTVSYAVNGGTAVTKSWTGSLGSCDTTTVTFTGSDQYNFVANTTYSIVATVSAPNGGTDNNSSNNSLTRSGLASGMIGTYTINPSGSGSSNYTTFTLAVAALASRGVAGAVTFSVSANTFTEQVTISSIPGISATNTVSFTGVSNTTSILSWASSCANTNDHTLKIDNVPYVEFRNLYIKNTYSSCYPIGVHIYGNSHYTKIKNCILEVVASTSSSGFYPLLINSGVNTSNPSVGSYVYGLEIDSNTINNGYYGIYMYGVTSTPYSNNNKFRYNIIKNAELYSAYFYYQDGLTFSNDSIYNKGTNASSAGLYMTSCISTGSNYHVINSNKIYNCYAYGAYMTSNTSVSSSIRNQFANNMIGGFSTTPTTPYGVYFVSNTNFDIFFNTISINNAITTASYGSFYLSGGTGLDIRNNIFSHTSTSATAPPFYCATNPISGVLLSSSAFNYNNFYQTTSTNRAYINATTYTTTTLIGALTYNSNSLVSVNPSFVSTSNLHVNTSTMNGVTISGYSTDIDGVTRVNPPDMGADEIPNAATTLDMAMDSIITPGNPNTTVGTTTISVRLKNIGTTTLTGATIKYSVNGGTAVSESWTGSLAQNATTTFTFTTTYSTSLGTAYTLRVWSEAPNAGTDGFMNNDTLSLVFTPKMSGVYTIDGSGSGVTNFTTFAACSTALGVNGVSGAVTINVAAATYTGQVVIPAITGASSVNTITIDGGSASTTILTNATTTSTTTHTVRLNGTSYVHLRNLTIRATNASYGWPVHIMNSNNVKVRNCAINFVGATNSLPTGSTSFHGVVVNNSTSSYSTSYAASNIDIDSNSIRGGYSGIYVAGSSSTGINIRYNTLDSCDTYGIFISSGNGVTVNNNTLNMNTVSTTTYGIYFSSCSSTGTNYHQISGNSIKNAGYSGIYLTSSSNTALYKGQLYNNMIAEGFRTSGAGGIYSSSSAYWNIYYNTVNYDMTSGYALYVSNTGQDVRNNMLICSATSGSAYPLYTNSSSYLTQCDYNNYYSAIAGTPNILNLAGTVYTSATYIGAQGYNTNSKNVAPGFAGTRNLHLSNACFNGGTPLTSATTVDIDGNTRSSSAPDIGADEVVAASNNIGVDAIVSPTAPLTAGTQNVVIRIKNYGGNTITSANVSYKVNGGTATMIAWTGSLAPCDTVSVYFTGGNQYNFASGGSYSVQAYTDGPNGNTDVATSNDTLTSATYCTGMSGTYTINPGGSGTTNYTSFAAAIAALQCGGVSGAVTFNVSAGTYSEQVVIPAITGASATNTITFDGGTAANAIIDYSASSTTAAHTVRIDNASYITLKNLTIHGSGSSYANSLHIYGSCNYVKVKYCVIDITGAGTVSTSSNFAPVVINGSTTVSSGTGSRPTYLEIDSNTIQYGYYGIFNYGITSSPYATNLKFRGNSIDSSYLYGFYSQFYVDTLYVNYNTVNLRITGSTTASGIYLSSIGSFGSSTYYLEVIGNKIINPGQYGIYAVISNTSSSVRSKVINNMIGGGFRNTTSYGFYGQSFYNIDFFFNTIVNDAATTLEQYSAAYFTSCLSLDARNNILVMSNSAATGLPFYSASGVTYSGFNYNNFYKAGTVTNLIYSQGGYQTPANFVGNGGYNINSINRSVAFTSSTNLHSTDAACFNGQSISSVTTDFDNQSRGATPDMGADENPAYSNDVAVDAIVTPVAPLASGLQDVKIRIRNAGSNTITAATVNYKVNGGSAVTMNWTGTLVPCDTTTVTFTGANQYNFAAGGTYSVQAYTSGANSTTDPNASNDTINGSSLCTGYAGTYTINPSGSGSTNFTSFGAAITALSCGGVTGPLTFNVASGTYNEQVLIPALTGTSASNTVTFQSATGIAADVTLTYNSTVSTSNYVVRLNGADYVNLKKMTLTATNTSFGHVIEFQNTSTYDTVHTCVLNGIATTSTSSNFAVVYSLNTRDNNSVVYNSTINYGGYGIYWSGPTGTPYVANVAITDNTFNGTGYQAIYLYYHNKSYIKGNTINLHNGTNTTFYGIYEQSCWNGTRILKNNITGSTNSATNTFGISSYQPTGTSSDSGLVANNVVAISQSSGSVYGIYSYLPQWSKVYHNSVNITGTATTVYAAYLYSNSATYSNNTAWNNIFVNRCAGASAWAIYFYNAGVANYYISNYNNLWSSGTNLGYNASNGLSYTTLATWQGSSTTPDLNSTNKLPGFTSATDLHHSTPCINNTGYIGANSFVTDDKDGNARSATTPDAGAYEFAGTAYDAAAGNITAPTGWSGSAQTVTFRVINRGSTTITSLDAGYNVNGGSVTSETFTGLNIAACDSATLSFSTQVTLSAGQSVLRVFTKGNINSGNSDALLSNDTAQGTICNALSGTYTINPSLAASGTNFQSFATAIAALSSCGVSGAVTVNVAAGTYSEQVTIPYFSGGSATNTVSFEGADSSTTIISYNTAVSASRYVVKFNGARYTSFRNFKVTSPNTTQAWGIQVAGTAATDTSNRIARCSVVIPTINSSNFAGIVATTSTTSPTTTGNYAQALTIDSCTVSGGYYGIVLTGYTTTAGSQSDRNIVRGCNIINTSYYGIYAYCQSQFTAMGNTITGVGALASNVNAYGIFLNYCDSFTATRNVITGQIGAYGLYPSNCNGGSGQHNLMANNMIQIGSGSSTCYGIYMTTANSYTDIVYNSVNVTGSATTFNGCALYIISPTSATIINNNFVNSGSAGYSVYMTPTGNGTTNFAQCDYNNYYATASNYINGSYANAAAFAGAINSGSDAASKSVNPNFTSSTNLHTPSATSLNAAATPYAGVSDDIDGNSRNGSTPDIGCDEFNPPSDDMGVIAITKPVPPVAAGASDVWVVIKNYAATTLTSATVKYVYNSTTYSQSWSGSLATNGTDTVKFTSTSGAGSTSQQSTFASGSNSMIAYTEAPNGNTDGILSNDTFSYSFCTGMSGTYTINPSGSGSTNYTTITAAISALQCGGVSGPVVFNIASGTYTGQYIIPSITGASSTNTITFQSAAASASAVTLQYNSTVSTSNYIVRLYAADYIKFSRVTFSALNSTYGQCIEITANGSDYATNNTVQYCVLNANSTGGSCAGIFATSSTQPNNLTVYGNTFYNGSYGVYVFGSGFGASSITGLVVDSNFFGTNVTNCPANNTLYAYYATAPQITKNTMYSRSTSTYGCWVYYGSGNINISRNTFIFSVGGTAIDVEYANTNGETSGGSIVNNSISVGGTSIARGIYLNFSALMDVAFNSIYMNSSLANSASNIGIYTYGSNTTIHKNVSIYNNSIYSTSSYAMYITGQDAPTTLGVIDTCNYNNIYSTGTNVAYVYPSNYTTFSSYKGTIYTGNDANSVSGNPGFTSSSNLTPNTSSANAWIGSNMGTQISWISTDINGNSRSTTLAGGAPDLGAYVYGVPSTTPTTLTTTGTHATSGTENFYFNGKLVASITWGSSGTLPTITPRFYPGAWADTSGVGIAGAKFGNAYWGITASGGSGYTYDITLYYDPAQLGTVGTESDVRMAKRSGPGANWSAFVGSSSSVNTTTKALTTPGLSSFSEFIITDQNNPLPVTWLDFNGTKAGKEVLLTWSTASEINNSRFDVERSNNGKDFVKIGEVAGHGTTLSVSSYSFIDPSAAARGVNALYYRLRQVDYNNDAELSKVVVIDMNDGKVTADAAQLYPNPFTSTVAVTTVVTHEQPITITVVDQFGRLILNRQINVTEGVNTLTLDESALWAKGVYFISIKGTQLNKTEKVIRY